MNLKTAIKKKLNVYPCPSEYFGKYIHTQLHYGIRNELEVKLFWKLYSQTKQRLGREIQNELENISE
jgi:hypothetical protein